MLELLGLHGLEHAELDVWFELLAELLGASCRCAGLAGLARSLAGASPRRTKYTVVLVEVVCCSQT